MFKKNKGFTLLEIVIVVAVVLILSSFASINLFKFPASATVSQTVDKLAEDIKTQQIKAMVGDTEGRGTPDAYGIFFTPTSYTLFHGSAYTLNEPSNFVTSLPTGYSIATTLPNSLLIFNAGNGEILNFSDSQNSITVRTTTLSEQRTILLNKYGALTNIQ